MKPIDGKIWLEEKAKYGAHLKNRKLPQALLKNSQINIRFTDKMRSDLKSKLLYIEERFFIDPYIWTNHYSYEDIIEHIKFLECVYEIALSPIQDEDIHRAFTFHMLRSNFPCPISNLRILLESIDSNLWGTLVSNAPQLDATAKTNVEWFMRQSRGIKACLDQFYHARSYGKAYCYLIAVYSFMENIYHFIHRLHIAELSAKPPSK